MTERTKQHPLDAHEEEVLQGLFHDAMVREGQAFSDTNDAEKEVLPQIPEELDAKCRQLIRESGGKQRNVPLLKNARFNPLKSAAIIAFACLIFFGSIATVSVDAIRVPVLNFLTDKDGRYSKILAHENERDQAALLSEKILSAPLPEGYVLVDIWDHAGVFGARFENEDFSSISVSFVPPEQSINYDVEDAEQLQIKVLNHDAIFIKKQGLRVIWMDEEYNGVFDVRASDLSENEFWKYVLFIAEI